MKESYEKIPSIIERLAEYKYFVILSLFVAYTDLFLVHATSKGLMDFGFKFSKLSENSFFAILYLFLLSVYLAAFVPTLIELVRWVIWNFFPGLGNLLSKSDIKNETFMKNSIYYRRYSELVQSALQEKDQIKLELVRDLKSVLSKQTNHEYQVSYYCFAALVLFLIGFFTIGEDQQSLIYWSFKNLFNYSDDLSGLGTVIFIVSWIFLGVMAVIAFKYQIIKDRFEEIYIYFPYESENEKEVERSELFEK